MAIGKSVVKTKKKTQTAPEITTMANRAKTKQKSYSVVPTAEEVPTVEDYQAEYNAAKAIGDKAGMDAAHKGADAVRGYETITTRDSSGNFVQTPVNAPAQTPLQPVAKTADDYYSARMEEITKANRQAQEAAAEAQRVRTESAISANEAYVPKVQANTEEQLRQAYIANMKAKAQAPASLAALGYTGGAAESSLLGLDASYQNARTGLQRSETDALSDIYANSANIRATGETALADLASTYYNNLLSAQQTALAQAQEQQNYQTQYEASQLEQEKSDYAATLGAYYQDYAAEKNKILSDGDTSNDWKATLLEAARQEKLQNISSAAAAAQQQQFENELALYKAQKSGTSSKSSTADKPTLTASQALTAYNNGIRTDQVLSALNYYYGMDLTTNQKTASTIDSDAYAAKVYNALLRGEITPSQASYLNLKSTNKSLGI